MSDQDKRAEEVWREAFLAWANVYPADSGGSRKKYRKAVAVEVAALAQARREGVEAFRDLAIQDWSAGKVYSRQTVNAWLRGLTARLLAKEEL